MNMLKVQHNFFSFKWILKLIFFYQETGIRPCSLDQSQKNIIPDLSERYMCEWEGCEQNDTDWTQVKLWNY